MTKELISNHILDLLNFMATFDPFQKEKFIYDGLDRFFRKSVKSLPFLIISRPLELKGQSKDYTKNYRYIYNRFHAKNTYDSESLQDVLVRLGDNSCLEKEWSIIKIGDSSYISLIMNKNEKQVFFGLLKTSEQTSSIYWDHLRKFLKTINFSQERILELRKYENLVYIDDVTGIYNQRKLMMDIDQAIHRNRELNEEFSILFIDIDHFKSVNDGHGHLAGTQLLKDMAEILKQQLRESDLIYRYGGDEFVILIPDITSEAAKDIGERILDAVKNAEFQLEENKTFNKENYLKLTVSIGVAGFPKDAQNKKEVLNIADKMMYEAKKTGRGRVCFTQDLLDTNKKKSS